MIKKYSQGVCHDGAAILKDGLKMSVDEIVAELNDHIKEVERLKGGWISVDDRLPEKPGDYIAYSQSTLQAWMFLTASIGYQVMIIFAMSPTGCPYQHHRRTYE